MDTATLVRELFDDGQKLLERLTQEGFEVTAGFWLRPVEDGGWLFYIASPTVERDGLSPAYQRLHTIIRGMPQPFWIDPLEVKLIGETNPITKDVLAIHSRAASPKHLKFINCPISREWHGNSMWGVLRRSGFSSFRGSLLGNLL